MLPCRTICAKSRTTRYLAKDERGLTQEARRTLLPRTKPITPIHTRRPWTAGVSSVAADFSPNLWRYDTSVKKRKKTMECANASPKKAAANGGADSTRREAVVGNEDRSMHNVRTEYVRASMCTVIGVLRR